MIGSDQTASVMLSGSGAEHDGRVGLTEIYRAQFVDFGPDLGETLGEFAQALRRQVEAKKNGGIQRVVGHGGVLWVAVAAAGGAVRRRSEQHVDDGGVRGRRSRAPARHSRDEGRELGRGHGQDPAQGCDRIGMLVDGEDPCVDRPRHSSPATPPTDARACRRPPPVPLQGRASTVPRAPPTRKSAKASTMASSVSGPVSMFPCAGEIRGQRA